MLWRQERQEQEGGQPNLGWLSRRTQWRVFTGGPSTNDVIWAKEATAVVCYGQALMRFRFALLSHDHLGQINRRSTAETKPLASALQRDYLIGFAPTQPEVATRRHPWISTKKDILRRQDGFLGEMGWERVGVSCSCCLISTSILWLDTGRNEVVIGWSWGYEGTVQHHYGIGGENRWLF